MGDGTGLVGRHHELDRLTAALPSGVVSVSGEPGVGKTAVVRAFASTAAARGATVLWGTCFEGAAQPAYGPWTMALAPLGVEVPAATGLSAPEARLRRWATVHQALLEAATATPLVLVLDDVQWASTETLDLLGYVAARAEGAPLLLVVTHRDPDPALHLGTPLSLLLAELARLPRAIAISVAGLDATQVAAFLSAALGDEIPGAIVRAVHDHTGGNPFYVREVARALAEEGKLVRRDGRWSSDFSLARLGIPATVRHAVHGRLSRLRPPTQALLRAASAFSGDLALEPVAEVAGLDEDAALDAVDEALATAFFQPAPAGRADAPYAFAHAIVRDALVATLSADRAARLHRRAAAALERHRPGEHAAVAEQYWLSRTLPGAEAGVAHCLAAADAASGQHASRRSVQLLGMALDLAPGEERPAVLGRLAVAQAQALDAEPARATTMQALEAVGPEEGAALVVRVAEALREGAPADAWEPLVRRGLELVGRDHGAEWARLSTLVDPVETVGTGPLRVGRWRCYPPDVVAVLRATGREDDEARAIDPFRPRTEAETADLLERAASWRAPRARMRALDLAGRDLSLRHGRPGDAVECYRHLLALGEEMGSMPAQAEAHGQLAICLALTGDLPAAEHHLATSAALTADLWPGHRLHLMGAVSSASVVAYLLGEGDWAVLAGRLERWLRTPAAGRAPFANVFAALCALAHVRAGQPDDARRMLHEVVALLDAMDPFDHAVAGSLWFATAATCEVADRQAADGLARLVDRHVAAGGPPGPASVDHAAGRLAAALGHPAAALEHLEAARRAATSSGSHGIRALVDLDLALLDADHEALDAARRRFTSLGMRGWAAGPSRAPSGLTAREVEVLRLLAAGRTSAEIAESLVVAPATVNRHIANIYVKIGARNRAEATGFAIGHGLHTSV